MNLGIDITAYAVNNHYTASVGRLQPRVAEQAESGIRESVRASIANRDVVEISGQESEPAAGAMTLLGDVPITFSPPKEPKLSTVFTGGDVSETARRLAALMDEGGEDIQFKTWSGMSEKQLADHFGSIGRQIDQAFSAGAITEQEYEDLNLGLETYTEAISSRAEREAATWEIAKQCAQATRAMIAGGASQKEMGDYAGENRETFRGKIDKFVEEFCSIDRELLAQLIRRVRDGEQLFPAGTEQNYGRKNTRGYFKNGYVPFSPAEYI